MGNFTQMLGQNPESRKTVVYVCVLGKTFV